MSDASSARPNRSVIDYDTEEALRRALLGDDLPGNQTFGISQEPNELSKNWDWVLPSYDPETTEVQSMEDELRRLQVLKSYLILDADREQAFERITALASRIYDVPIALISLVDLGRQWFLSNRGLDARETPRRLAFCAHAIMLKGSVLIVPDASKDFRFKDNQLVTGPPNIRFYAGAPLVSPEGYKLGTFCVIDDKPRPDGLTTEEQATLVDLADMAVKVMVDRRFQMENRENPAQLIAYTAHDLMTPLTGVQLSLSLLKDDEDVQEKLDSSQLELLTTASSCAELMIRICQTAIETLRQDASSSLKSEIMQPDSTVPVTKVKDLVKSLYIIMDPIPKGVPLILTLDEHVPPIVACDDLRLFRSALNLLSHAIERAKVGYVHLRIYSKESVGHLVFECEDTGPDIEESEYHRQFQPRRGVDGSLQLGLSSVASLIKSLKGEYGFRPRHVPHSSHHSAANTFRRPTGAIFWFSVPLFYSNLSPEEKTNPFLPKKKEVAAFKMMRRSGSGSGSSLSSSGKRRSSIAFDEKIECRQSSSVGSHNAVFDSVAKVETDGVHAISETIKSKLDLVSHGTGEDSKIPAIVGTPAGVALYLLNNNTATKGPRKRKALVIDDSAVIRKSLSRALDKLGFHVTEAVNGMEGLKELKAELFDLVLCDFLMPVMDGLDCVKQYRAWESEHRPEFRQLIIGISAHANVNDSGQGREAGMDDFRPKPISIKTLTEIQESDAVSSRSRYLDTQEGSSMEVNVVDGDPLESAFTEKRSALLVESNGVGTASKRPRMAESSSVHVCLLAVANLSVDVDLIRKTLESEGWHVQFSSDGQKTLSLLQTRNWDAVLIDENLPLLAGSPCIMTFREWEEQNRINGQRNVFLLCEGGIPTPSDRNSVVQPPTGFNGVLSRPLRFEDLSQLLHANGDGGALDIVIRKN